MIPCLILLTSLALSPAPEPAASLETAPPQFARAAPPTVARNALVMMEYRRGGLAITAAGRALGAGNSGAVIRVMNLDTRTTVLGTIVDSGRVRIE